ncbi:hypothetical protein TBLA_0G03610 [Henningerozyma blattae CBS 6284]|uniref:Uncharacterized protein n=1 Tax=Henningerozyma blattae (strain ATCC 34711 / CBS 6284 / DSM 70876 / NBRC 10599 / NRRL Y-10934 / UCD 77-7) TaxID=1071380 RepID=I2H7E3_HENB6|nr:hypothetical protein TBLA_0G03610 [Tetrapisispora blattae CBS 6284]CCH62295.1 hypothetical protein TBLA_0G03610 [Tetrapisispora blattae CBS 6284]
MLKVKNNNISGSFIKCIPKHSINTKKYVSTTTKDNSKDKTVKYATAKSTPLISKSNKGISTLKQSKDNELLIHDLNQLFNGTNPYIKKLTRNSPTLNINRLIIPFLQHSVKNHDIDNKKILLQNKIFQQFTNLLANKDCKYKFDASTFIQLSFQYSDLLSTQKFKLILLRTLTYSSQREYPEFYYYSGLALLLVAKKDVTSIECLLKKIPISDGRKSILKYCVYSSLLKLNQFESTFIELTKYFDNLAIPNPSLKIQNFNNDIELTIFKLLAENYFLQLATFNPHAATHQWVAFIRKYSDYFSLSYQFYLQFIENLLLSKNAKVNWEMVKRIYGYAYPLSLRKSVSIPMPIINFTCLLFPGTKENFASQSISSNLSLLLQFCIKKKDTQLFFKILNESIIRNIVLNLNSNIYLTMLKYLHTSAQPNCNTSIPMKHLLYILDSHGSLILKQGNNFASLQYINFVNMTFEDMKVLWISFFTRSKFFENICLSINILQYQDVLNQIFSKIYLILKTENLFNLKYILVMSCRAYTNVLRATTSSNTTNDTSFEIDSTYRLLATLSNIIREIYEIYSNATSLDNSQFDSKTITIIKKTNLPKINNLPSLSNNKSQFYSLSYLIKSNPIFGLNIYHILRNEGYLFDTTTYLALLYHCRFIDSNIVSVIQNELEQNQCISECLSKAFNKAIITAPLIKINEYIQYLPITNSKFLLSLPDQSIIKLFDQTSDALDVIWKIGFPTKFQSEDIKSRHKLLISYIYKRLYSEQLYQEIINFQSCCGLNDKDIIILLKSYLKLFKFNDYEKCLHQFNNRISQIERNDLSIEYSYRKKFEQFNIQQEESLISKNNREHMMAKISYLNNFPLWTIPRVNKNIIKPHSIHILGYELLNQLFNLSTLLKSYSYYTDNINELKILKSDTLQKYLLVRFMLYEIYDATMILKMNSSLKLLSLIKMKNYLRFRKFLNCPNLNFHEMKIYISILERIDKGKLVELLDNIVESQTFNKDKKPIFLEEKCKFKLENNEMKELVKHLREKIFKCHNISSY